MKGLFKIYPSFINTEYIRIKKRYDSPNYISTLIQSEKRDVRAELPKQIKQLDDESVLNWEQYKKLKGTPIKFG